MAEVRLTLAAMALLALGCSGGYRTVAFDPHLPELLMPEIEFGSDREFLRLAVIGDMHGSVAIAEALQNHHRDEPFDAVLITGDNIGHCGATAEDDPQWDDVIESLSPMGVPLFPVLGNHDYGNPEVRKRGPRICGEPHPESQVLASATFQRWDFPARNYVIVTPVASLYMIDTTPAFREFSASLSGSGSAEQLLSLLAQTLQSSRGWKVAVGHHQIFTSAARRFGISRMPSRTMLRLNEILVYAGVELYISGHQHHLELITVAPPERNPVYLISGAASRPKEIRSFSRHTPRPLYPNSIPYYSRGYAVLEIDEQVLEIRFYDGNGQLVSDRYVLRQHHPRLQVVPRSQ